MVDEQLEYDRFAQPDYRGMRDASDLRKIRMFVPAQGEKRGRVAELKPKTPPSPSKPPQKPRIGEQIPLF